MRTLWQGLVRIVFWSFERGTWPYDVAVALIVTFVLLAPRSWFNDRPPAAPLSVPTVVELGDTDPTDDLETYRVDARLLGSSSAGVESDLEYRLREVVRKNAKHLRNRSGFQIVRIAPVRGHDGAIAFYDVAVKP
jgi:hypothetical protein